MGVAHSGGAGGRTNVDTKQDNTNRASLPSARKEKNATRLAGFRSEDGRGFTTVIVIIKGDKG